MYIADAVLYFMKKTKENLINIGTGKELTIKQYAEFIMKRLGLKFQIKFDKKYPDGTPRKFWILLWQKKYGWKAKTSLNDGFNKTYKEFIEKTLFIKFKTSIKH